MLREKLDTYVDTFVRETWRNSRTLFLCFTEEDRNLFHSGHRNIPSIVAGKKGLQQNSQPEPQVLGKEQL